jgi:hypothetical protein
LREFKEFDNDNTVDIEEREKNFDLFLEKIENNKKTDK